MALLSLVEKREREKLAARERRKRQPYRMQQIQRLHRYGLTPEQFRTMYESQNGQCMICRRELIDRGHSGLQVDHSHTNNKVRALLCANCNRGLGQFCESTELLERAISYLRSYEEK